MFIGSKLSTTRITCPIVPCESASSTKVLRENLVSQLLSYLNFLNKDEMANGNGNPE